MAFSPFEERLLATTGDDGMAKLWVIENPKGIVEQTDEADIELCGHTKNCKGLAWHTSVENCLATFALDQTVRVWDINDGKWDAPILSTTLEASANYVRWSPDGRMLGCMLKNKTMCYLDPRQEEASILKANSH